MQNLDLGRKGKEQLLRLLLTKKIELDRTRLQRFLPNPGFQEKFFKSSVKNRLVATGNQSGKTHAGAVEAAMLSLGSHPHKYLKVPNTGLIISAQNFKEGIEKVIMPKLKAVVGSDDIKRIRNNSNGIPSAITWASNSITHLMSAEQDDITFEGTTHDWVWIDEPVRREIFIAVKRGMLTTDGLLWMTCTPLDEPWIYEDLYVPGLSGDPDIQVFEGKSSENIHISEKQAEEFKRRLTKDEYEARWEGKFRHLSGRVFKEYEPKVSFIEPFAVPYHWPVWCSIDPHRNKPHAALFLAVAPNGLKYCVNEVYADTDLRNFAGQVLHCASQYKMVDFLVDTSAQEAGWGKVSARSILRDCGLSTRLAHKHDMKTSGILLINQGFKDKNLFVFQYCKRLHRELMNQIYKKNKTDRSQILEEPEKRFDDQTDNLRYILVENPRFRGIARPMQLVNLRGI